MLKSLTTLSLVLTLCASRLLAQSSLADSVQFFALATERGHSTTYVTDSVPQQINVSSGDTVIHWMTMEEALAMQKQRPRKVFVEVYATWCGWCKKTDGVLANAEIARYINANYYPVKFNCETKSTVTFKGREYKFINEGNYHVNELALFLLNYKQSYPGIVILNEDANVVGMRSGYMDEIMMENVANYYGSDAYREMPFNEFEETFVGKVK